MSRSAPLVLALAAALSACPTRQPKPLVQIDGSSTVYPIAEAVAEEYQRAHPGARVTVAVSGTGGGLNRLCAGEVDVATASRPIEASERKACAARGVDYVELPVAYDGLVVAVHPSNTWANSITVAELRALWAPEAQERVLRWSDIRTGWPDQRLSLFGPGVGSGTYDYFTQAVVGRTRSSRSDFAASEDDNALVSGVAGDPNALGFFGYVYFESNRARLKALAVDDGDARNGVGAVAPSRESIREGRYQPLARPLFIYVSRASAERPEVGALVDFWLIQGAALAAELGEVPLPEVVSVRVADRFARRVTGSAFARPGAQVGLSVEALAEALR